MKVYFDATPTKLDQYKDTYHLIGHIIEELGHSHTSRWILDFNQSFFDLPRSLWGNHYIGIKKALELADVVVADISVSSTSIGQQIQHALAMGKPIIALRDHNVYPNIFLEGAGEVESKIVVVEYTKENLKRKLKDAFEYISEWLETRFTMLIDGKIKRHLDKVADAGISRSEYIRDLILKDAKENWK